MSGARRRRLLVISTEAVGEQMGGPGIRSVELARALSGRLDVMVASPPGDGDPPDLDIVRFAPRRPTALQGPLAWTDAVFAQPPWPPLAHALRRSGRRLIFDVYTPEQYEVLEGMRERSPLLRRVMAAITADRLEEALHAGHHFVCAGEKQRDLWIGAMLGERLIRPEAYDRDPTFRSVLDLVPFGIPADPPAPSGPGPRERFSEIAPDDEIVLWNGGIWNWLDAQTAVRAAPLLADRRPRAKLVFMGGSSSPSAMRATEEARRVAIELNVLGSVVFFNDEWVPYERRAAWLTAASCAVSTHVEQLETRFAYRTRLLDCIWAGLPIVCTEGDELADRVEAEGLGATAPQGDERKLAGVLAQVLARGRHAYAEPLARAASELRWSRVAQPIARFVEAPETRRLGRHRSRRAGQMARGRALRAVLLTLHLLRMPTWPRV